MSKLPKFHVKRWRKLYILCERNVCIGEYASSDAAKRAAIRLNKQANPGWKLVNVFDPEVEQEEVQ